MCINLTFENLLLILNKVNFYEKIYEKSMKKTAFYEKLRSFPKQFHYKI